MTKPPMKNRMIRVPDRLWDDARATAAERGENLSEIIRDALRRYVERHRKQ